ncbi:TafC family fimbrial protein [Haloarcula brevis]|uniref:LamG domain-containing protein n=1 Tax=Haloarcula brevis TaxID=3111453 RepID=UPI00300ECC41
MSRKWTRRSALAFVASGAGLLAAETAGVTTIDAKRSSTLDTADDAGDALLGISADPVVGVDGQRVTLATLTNNFDESLTRVRVDPPFDAPLENLQAPNRLRPGESGAIEATLACDSPVDTTVDLAITATGPSHRIEVRQPVDVECRDPRVSWWHFEDAGDIFVPDSWPAANNGYHTFTKRKSRPDRGDVFEFRRDDVVWVPHDPTLDLTGAFSLSVWVAPKKQKGLTRLFSKWNSRGDDSYQFGFGGGWNGSDDRELLVETTNEYRLTGVTVSKNRWSHVVWTHGPQEDAVYVDGAREGQTFSLPDAAASTQPLRIGGGVDSRGDLSYGFVGGLDEPKVYDAALTAEQVATLYESSRGGSGGDITG